MTGSFHPVSETDFIKTETKRGTRVALYKRESKLSNEHVIAASLRLHLDSYMRSSLVVHSLIAGVMAAASAISCRLLFLIPFWLGGVIGVLIYVVIVIGIRAEERFD